MIVALKNRLILNDNDKFIVDKLSYHSARLYNVCTYTIREYYNDNNAYLPYKEQYHVNKLNENFTLLINDSAQQIHRIVDRNFKSFFSLLKLKAKGKYSAKIDVPRYLPKEDGWSVFVAGRSARVKGNKVHIGLSKDFRKLYNIEQKDLILNLSSKLNIKELKQLQIKPLYGGKEYEVIFTYEKEDEKNNLNKLNYISLDCGLDNLITMFDKQSQKSFIIDGKPLKSVNQYYNKKKAKLYSAYAENNLEKYNTNKIIKLSEYRKNYINNYLDNTVKKITDYCVNNNIGTLVIGEFAGVKQNINLGKKNNQNFVSIPYGKLKQKLETKCIQRGIDYILQEESYTSKCSAFD